MKKYINRTILLLSVCVAGISNIAVANEPPALRCLNDAMGEMLCAPREYGATITQDALGDIVCSVGNCARDPLGQLKCAQKPNGQVMATQLGDIKCEGGCAEPSQALCQRADAIFK